MTSFLLNYSFTLFLLFSSIAFISLEARTVTKTDKTQDYTSFHYHNGALLTGHVSVNFIWYGKFKPSQRAIITDFVASLSSSRLTKPEKPTVTLWWKTVEKYYQMSKTNHKLTLTLGEQILDEEYSLGKSLTEQQIKFLASKSSQRYAVNVVLTSADVSIQGFCINRCGSHGWEYGRNNKGEASSKFGYIWIGNSEKQCPGQCAWPFHAPVYGPQDSVLVAPNNDVGLDGMVINLATLLAGTVTNPFGDGFYQGPKTAPYEAGSACSGVYGKGSYPGYAGELLVDEMSGGSYNVNGVNGRKFLVPALFDPEVSACSTLV